jgi:putative acetyltransferase
MRPAAPLVVELVRTPTDDVRALVHELETELAAEYSPEQRHGLKLEAIFAPHVRFFIARLQGEAIGCGGVALFADFAEVKRMYVRAAFRGRGGAQALLARIEAETLAAGLRTLRLETGDRQAAALRVYETAGFHPCGAFGDYVALEPAAISTSLFFEKQLSA